MQDTEYEDQPQADVLQGIGFVAAIFLAALAVAAAAGVGHDFLSDARAAEVTAQHVADADARKEVRPEQLLPLSKPLRCDATMKQSVAGVVLRETCYARKEPQVWL